MAQGAGRITFDTNILFYAVDTRDRGKHERCCELLRAAMDAGVGFVTVQALGEFVYAVVRKKILTRAEAAEAARDWATVFDVETATGEAFDLALDWWAAERLSYWDALLVTTSAIAGATACVSEDLNDGSTLAGVEIINPFAQEFGKRITAHGLKV